jgi:hypothetical protein
MKKRIIVYVGVAVLVIAIVLLVLLVWMIKSGLDQMVAC